MNSFVAKLKASASKCEFGELQDRMIQDQIFEKLYDPDGSLVRRLYRIPNITVDAILKFCRTDELANEHAKKNQNSAQQEQINALKSQGRSQYQHTKNPRYRQWQPRFKPQQPHTFQRCTPPTNQRFRPPAKNTQQNLKCFRCGRFNHKAENCIATRDKYCNKCGCLGHFEIMC
jgi:hypothetical protein